MNTTKTYIVLFLSFLLISACSTSDNSNEQDVTFSASHHPKSVNSYWNYKVKDTNENTKDVMLNTDSLYITSKNGKMITLDVNNNLAAFGNTTRFLSSGTLNATENKLIMTGDFALPKDMADFIDIDIDLTDLIIYDITAEKGVELSSVSGKDDAFFGETPLKAYYNVTTKALGFYENITLNDKNYTNVVSAELTFKLTLQATSGFFEGNNIVDNQDVLIASYYFAEGIGLIQSNSSSNFKLESVLQAGQTNSTPIKSVETLESYFIAE